MERLTNTDLRAARRILGLSGQELAGRLNVRADTLRRWESGRDHIPYRVREELAAIAAERAERIAILAAALASGEDI